MTPKEKAENLVYEVFRKGLSLSKWHIKNDLSVLKQVKKVAIVAVDLYIDGFKCTHIGYGKNVMNAYFKYKLKYWNDVKSEIEKL